MQRREAAEVQGVAAVVVSRRAVQSPSTCHIAARQSSERIERVDAIELFAGRVVDAASQRSIKAFPVRTNQRRVHTGRQHRQRIATAAAVHRSRQRLAAGDRERVVPSAPGERSRDIIRHTKRIRRRAAIERLETVKIQRLTAGRHLIRPVDAPRIGQVRAGQHFRARPRGGQRIDPVESAADAGARSRKTVRVGRRQRHRRVAGRDGERVRIGFAVDVAGQCERSADAEGIGAAAAQQVIGCRRGHVEGVGDRSALQR